MVFIEKKIDIFFRNTGLTCSDKWLEKIGDDELSHALDTNNQLHKCLPRCERQSESATFSLTSFPVKSTFYEHQDFCLALSKVTNICKNPIKSKLFEASPDQEGVSCNDILNANKLCNENFNPNATVIQNNSKMSRFLFQYAKNNFAVLRVFIKDPYYTLIKCDEQISLISFLGNTGGLLSLCLGLSLISIFEIFYHLINVCNDMFQKGNFKFH